MRTNRPEVAAEYHKVVGDLRAQLRESKILFTGKDNAPANFKLNLSGGGATQDWTTPRHRHTFEQIRHPLSGDYTIKKGEVLPAGWVAYFPESAWYGPQLKGANLKMLVAQYGGPGGLGYWSMPQCKAAMDALKARGRNFHEGVCTWTDKDGKVHNQDASEAVEEEARGQVVEYSPQRYKDIVMMNPAAFDWVKDGENAGVARKHLGTFTERDVRIEFIRLDKGARLPFGLEDSVETLFLKEGALTHANVNYDRQSAFCSDADEKPEELTAIEDSELVYFKLPTF